MGWRPPRSIRRQRLPRRATKGFFAEQYDGSPKPSKEAEKTKRRPRRAIVLLGPLKAAPRNFQPQEHLPCGDPPFE